MHKYLYIILGLGFLLRFISVGNIPPGISHDELENVNNGISLIKTGHDLSGESLPLTVGGLGLVAVPAYVAGFSAFIFGQSIAGVRMLAVLTGTANILFLYFIAKKLANEKAALFAAAAYAISPWGIHFSRMMYDPPVALCFALGAVSLLLYAKKTNHIVLGWLLLGLSSLSYYGYIFTIPFVSVLLIWYRRKALKKIGVVFGLLILGVSYLLLAAMITSPNKTFGGERQSEIIFLQTERLSEKVIFQRSQSTAPDIIDRVFINKATLASQEVVANYLSAFSLENIFTFGEASKILSLENIGFLYLLELPLIIVGAYSLFRENKKNALLIFMMILVAPVTMALGDERTYVARASLMFPFLLMLAGVGIRELSKKYKAKFAVLIFLLYCLSVSGFIYQYFYRYPLYAREIWNDSEHQLSEYLTNNSEVNFVIATVEPRETFMEYMFYSSLEIESAQSAYRVDKPIFIKNIIFRDCVLIQEKPEGTTLILDSDCGENLESADEVINSREGANSNRWGIFKD